MVLRTQFRTGRHRIRRRSLLGTSGILLAAVAALLLLTRCTQWTDTAVVGDYRIQEHALLGVRRLVDTDGETVDTEVKGDDLAAGARALTEARPGLDRSRELVLTLHSLAGSPGFTEPLVGPLTDAGYQAMPLSYASTHGTIADHTRTLETLLDGLNGNRAPGQARIARVHLIGHSLGGVIIRNVIAADRRWPPGRPALGCAVMMGSPNYGARLAEVIGPLARLLGPSGPQLTPAEIARLPPLEPLVAAGRVAFVYGDWWNLNPLLSGIDDGIVRMTDVLPPTLLPPACRDNACAAPPSLPTAIRVQARHDRLPDDAEAQAATVSFLMACPA